MDLGNILGTQDMNLLTDRVDSGRMLSVRVEIAAILLDNTATPSPAATNILQIAKASCCDLLSVYRWIELCWVSNSINDHR
jgi:hypothetical protein